MRQIRSGSFHVLGILLVMIRQPRIVERDGRRLWVGRCGHFYAYDHEGD